MYMLDTNICIYVINNKPPQVFEHFKSLSLGDVGISGITACELAFGVEKSGSVKNKSALQKFLAPLMILPFTESIIWDYATIRTYLEKKGQPIGSLDMLIAAHARHLQATLVTNNLREFQKVPDLKLENWL